MTDSPQPDSLVKKVLERIEGERLTPRPRWEFLARDWFFWLLGGISVALGALAIAAALFELANAGWPFFAETHQDFLTFFLQAAPFLWLLALALFILLGYENIRRTRRGYRYPFWLIATGAVLTSAVLGSALFAAGLGENIEEAIGDHPPFYRPIELEEHGWWLSPARGLLGGTVISVSSTSDTFMIKDFKGDLWQVDAAALSSTSATALERGGVVRVIGAPQADATSTFEACFVFPWEVEGARRLPPLLAPFAPPPVEKFSAAVRSNPCTGVSPYKPTASAGE
ncbi:MAG: hypothetical protein ACREGR_03675 [Minisyncoccia bacterium]